MVGIAYDPEQALASQVRWFAFEPQSASSSLVSGKAKNIRLWRIPSFPTQLLSLFLFIY
jgi:hypothetical protein